MVNLLSLECDADAAYGYAESVSSYFGFFIDRRDKLIRISGIFPKRSYQNYEHFAQVCGKFDPDSFFLKRPIPIALNFDNLKALYLNSPLFSKFE